MASEAGQAFMLQLTPVERTLPGLGGNDPVSLDGFADRLPDALVVVDQDGVIRRANRSFVDLAQAGAEGAVVGEQLGRWLCQPGADLSVLMANLARHGVVRMFATRLQGDLGTDTEVEISAARNGDGKASTIALLMRDVGRRLPEPNEGQTLRAALASLIGHPGNSPSGNGQSGKVTLLKLVDEAVEMVERHYIEAALEMVDGNRTAASELLGLSRQSLYKKLARYELDGNTSPEEARVRLCNGEVPGAMSRALSAPAFGQADLTNCEREQIHLAGSIQPHGALLVVREPDLVIVQASANADAFLGLASSPLGQRLDALDGDLLTCIRPHLDEPLTAMPQVFRCNVGSAPDSFDGLVHRAAGGGLIIELERAGPPVDLSRHLESTLQSIVNASSIIALCDETARIFRDLTGYDRVMVYRFDDDGHGEVISEERQAELEAFLGNRYPASDIPQIARRLYERNRIRVLADVDYAPVPLRPACRRSPAGTSICRCACCAAFHRSMCNT